MMSTIPIADYILKVLIIFLLIYDTVVTIKKYTMEHTLWTMIKNGEVSYIQACKKLAEIYGYDEGAKQKSRSTGVNETGEEKRFCEVNPESIDSK